MTLTGSALFEGFSMLMFNKLIDRAADTLKDFGLETHFRVFVTCDGNMFWNIYGKFQTRCDLYLHT